MQYVSFGSLEKPVSRFGMGCMRLPQAKASDGSETIDETEAIRMIRYAADHGVNYFDTAYAYGGARRFSVKRLRTGIGIGYISRQRYRFGLFTVMRTTGRCLRRKP